MVMEELPGCARLAMLGVARISYGALPYPQAMARLREVASKIFA